MGCDGCELWDKKTKKCYAGVLHTRFGGVTPGYAPTFKEVTLFPGRMEEATRWRDLRGTKRAEKPWLDGLPRLIFVSDMSDALSKAVTFNYLNDEVIQNVTSELGQRHQWLWLTKRPARMAKFSNWLARKNQKWPSNLWVGTSVTGQKMTSRIAPLIETGNADTIRFLSVEPQHERIDLQAWLPKLQWVIQGGESGRGASAFDVSWATSLIKQCRQQRIPYFLKQLGTNVVQDGERLRFNDSHAGDWSEWQSQLQVREMPDLQGIKGPPQRAIRNTAPKKVMKSGVSEKGRMAALKAWETRRARQAAAPKKK